MRGDHELFHLLKAAPLLRLVHLLQVGPRTEISFFDAHQYDALDGGGLLGILHDLLPLRQALHVEHIDRLAGVIKPRQQDAIVQDHGLEVCEQAGRNRAIL